MSTSAQRDRALALCREGKTISEAARLVGAPCTTVSTWCRRAGVSPPKGRRGPRSDPQQETCARASCKKPIPASRLWRKGLQRNHCGWTCCFETVYDRADADAHAEGLTGSAFEERRRALYLERSAPKDDRARARPRRRAPRLSRAHTPKAGERLDGASP